MPAVAAEGVMGSVQRTLAMALTLALGSAFVPWGAEASEGGFLPPLRDRATGWCPRVSR